MRKAYIVTGHTGSYSDYTEWVVKAYFNHLKAELLLQACKDTLAVYAKWCDEDTDGGWDFDKFAQTHVIPDPQYTGSSYDPGYFIVPIEIEEDDNA